MLELFGCLFKLITSDYQLMFTPVSQTDDVVPIARSQRQWWCNFLQMAIVAASIIGLWLFVILTATVYKETPAAAVVATVGPTPAPAQFVCDLATETSGILPVANGGTSLAALTARNLLVGAGTNAVTFIAPSTSGNVLTSNGLDWISAAAVATGSINTGNIGSVWVFE